MASSPLPLPAALTLSSLLSYSGDAAINPPSTAAAALCDPILDPSRPHVERWVLLRPPGALPAAGSSHRPPRPGGGSPVRGEVSLEPSSPTHLRQRRRVRLQDSPLRSAPCAVPLRRSTPSSSVAPESDSRGDSALCICREDVGSRNGKPARRASKGTRG